MKKIVALVLSLVMALSLCTVAFGASYTLNNVGLNEKGVMTAKVDDITTAKIKFVAEKNWNNGGGILAHFALTEDFVDETYGTCSKGSVLVPCDQDEADYAVYEGKAFKYWVKWVSGALTQDEATLGDITYYMTLTAQDKTTAKASCKVTHFLVDGYVDSVGNFYVKDAQGTNAKVGNQVVKVIKTDLPEDVIYASHVFGEATKDAKTGFDTVTCLICKGEFVATNDEAVATKNGLKISTSFAYDDAAAKQVYNENAYENGYDLNWGQKYAGSYKFVWETKAGTTPADTSKDTTKDGVNSAKTFDAGIAMYVGMSLLSVAGSAVVIGKKKEF